MPTPTIVTVDTFRIGPFGQYRPQGVLSPQGAWAGTTGSTMKTCGIIGGYKANGNRSLPDQKNSASTSTPNGNIFGLGDDLLMAQTIGGTVNLTMLVDASQSNLFLRLYIWVLEAGTASGVRGVLLDHTMAGAIPTTPQAISTGSVALSSLAVQDGDRLVVEIGHDRVGSPTTGISSYWVSGGMDVDGTEYPDLQVGDTDNLRAPTLVFSNALQIYRPSPEAGDVLGGNGPLYLYNGTTGEFARIIRSPSHGIFSGGAIQADGKLLFCADTGFEYASTYVWRFNADLSFDTFLPIGTGINPHSLALDVNGNIHVGFVGDDGTGCGEDGNTGDPSVPSYAIQRITPADVIDATYNVAPDEGGTQAIDISDAGDLIYTSIGRQIKQYSFSLGQLPDFAELPPASTGEIARGMRILPNGDVLVADGTDIKRVAPGGAIVQTYTLPDSANPPPIYLCTDPDFPTYTEYYDEYVNVYGEYGDWGVVSLDPTGTAFWVANRADYNSSAPDHLMPSIAKFDLVTGELLILITAFSVTNTGGSFCSGGLLVYGEFRQVGVGSGSGSPGLEPVIGPLIWVEWQRLIHGVTSQVPGLPPPPPFPPPAPGEGGSPFNPPPPLSGSPADIDGDYGPISEEAPGSYVEIQPGQDAAAIVNANGAGTTYYFRAGYHRHQNITPKNNDKFYGEYGAVLSGARVLQNWNFDGTNYFVTGQTQQGFINGGASCIPGYPRCAVPEDVFYDETPLRSVPSLASMGSGRFFFDYDADRIYIRDNPSGHVIQTSVSSQAFGGSASGVLLRNLVIEKFATTPQFSPINGGNAWTIERCDIRHNHGVGLIMKTNRVVRRCRIHRNGQLGIGSGPGDGSIIVENEIAYNNYAGVDAGWEGGGSKFSETNGLTVRSNWVHHNTGPGLWTDINNVNILYEYNLVEDNTGIGIFHEISFDATIRYNVVRRNGFGFDVWLWGAGIMIAASGSVSGLLEVHNNEVDDNADGIALVQQNRGSGEPHGTGLGIQPWIVKNVYVHHNTIRIGGTGRQHGAVQDVGSHAIFDSRNNNFDFNTYYLAGADSAPFEWKDGLRTEAGWKAFGQELNGNFNY